MTYKKSKISPLKAFRKSGIPQRADSLAVKRYGLCAGAIAILIFCMLCSPPYGYAQDKIVAVVNSEVITRKDLRDYSNFMRMQMAQAGNAEELDARMEEMEREFLEKLIEDQIILQEAKKGGIVINQAMLAAKINQIKGNYLSEADFHADLSRQGMTPGDLEEKISGQMLMYAVIEEKVISKIVVAPSEVTAYYQQHQEDFKEPEQWEFRTLRIDDPGLLDKISKFVKRGENLEDLAQKYSLPMNKIRVYRGGELREDIEKSVFNLNLGESSEPFKIDRAYYFFRLDRLIPPRDLKLDEVQEDIRLVLLDNQRGRKMAEWIEKLKDLSYIKIIQ